MNDSGAWGMSVFRYEKKHVDLIFYYLLVNGNSIADTFECYTFQFTPEHHYKDVVRLIENCHAAIKDGCKTSDEWWEKHMERVKKNCVKVNGQPI